MSYKLVNGQIVKIEKRGYNPSKPGLVQWLRTQYPKGTEAAALGYASALYGLPPEAEWEHNGEVSRGASNKFVADAIRDLVADRQTADRADASGRVGDDERVFARALQNAATLSLTTEDYLATQLHAAGGKGFLDPKTGALKV